MSVWGVGAGVGGDALQLLEHGVLLTGPPGLSVCPSPKSQLE